MALEYIKLVRITDDTQRIFVPRQGFGEAAKQATHYEISVQNDKFGRSRTVKFYIDPIGREAGIGSLKQIPKGFFIMAFPYMENHADAYRNPVNAESFGEPTFER